MPEQYTEFKRLLKAGIGERTYVEFAKAANVTPEWISRSLNKETIPRPSVTTLKKIAAHMTGGITLNMLLESCGYTVTPDENPGISRSYLPLQERIIKNAEDIDEGLKTMIGYRQFWSDIEEFFGHFLMLFSVEDLACTVENDMDYCNKFHRGAERSMLVNFSWENNSHVISTFAVLYYLRTDKGKLFFFGYSLENEKLKEAGLDIPFDCEIISADKNLAFTAISKNKRNLSTDKSTGTVKKRIKYETEIKFLQGIVDRKNKLLPDDPCKIFIDDEKKKEILVSTIAALHLLEKYQELGTPEEIANVMAKQTPKKPIIRPWSPARCPSCGEELSESVGDGYYKHFIHLKRCPNKDCEQFLDW